MRTAEQKRNELFLLAKLRQSDRLPPHNCLADFHDGFYECDYVSPWSKSANNVDAELMLLGQDWTSSDSLDGETDKARRDAGQDLSSATNTNLREFLKHVDIQFFDTYATNLFPFIKHGSKSAKISPTDLVRCARIYALPQIEIISPRIAVCLGKLTFDAVRQAAGLTALDWSEARPSPTRTRIGSVEVYGLPHPGPLGTSNAGGKEAAALCWKLLSKRLSKLRKERHFD